MNAFLAAINDPGTVIVAVVGLLGAMFTSWYQTRKAHQSQLALLSLSQEREDKVRLQQFEESDRADRLLILEYIDQLLPRLSEITSIYFLAGGPINKDEDERQLFCRLQSYMKASDVDSAHPERTLSIRLAFLLFQLIAAVRLALNARWSRPLSETQARFLAHYEADLEPILCSGRYPGDEFLYREQIEIIADEMLSAKQYGIVRPLNWNEFVTRYMADGVLSRLANLVAGRFRFVFDDTNPRTTAPRRALQCRLAILALYLIRLSEESGATHWSRRADAIWPVVTSWFAWEREQQQEPRWYVFSPGDVATRLEQQVAVRTGGVPSQT